MKKIKIIIALLLLYAAGTEYISASHELLTYWSPGILIGCLLMIVAAAFLIGNGRSPEGFDVKSLKMVKYLALSLLLFIVFAFIGLICYKEKPEMVIVNGTEVNIAGIMKETKKLIPDAQQRKAYCMCIVEKLTKDKEVADKYKTEFKAGDIDDIFKETVSQGNVDLMECASFIPNVK